MPSETDSAVAVFTTNILPPAFYESQVVQDGVGGFDGLAQAAGLALGADGHHLFVAGTGDSAVAILDRSPSTSLLSMNSLAQQGVAGVSGLGKVDSLCAEPSGKSVYAGGGESPALFSFTPGVVALAIDPFDFGLDFVQSNPLPGFSLVGSSHVAVASLPDSSKILAAEALSSRRFFGGQLSIYDRDSLTGALTAQQTIPDGGDGTIGVRGAQSVVASPDGKNAYVLGSDEAVTSSFRRDAATGALSFTGYNRLSGDQSFQIAPPIRAAVMSPDGKNLYETAYRQFSLTAFERDASTGLLLPTQVFHDTDVAAGLVRPTALAVSPDGKNVYVVGGNGPDDSAVAMFARDPSTGALTFHGADKNGPGGLNGFIARPSRARRRSRSPHSERSPPSAAGVSCRLGPGCGRN